MTGKVLTFDEGSKEGLVVGPDEQRYAFTQEDWSADGSPSAGQKVDFVPEEDKATQVYPIKGGVDDFVAQGQQALKAEKSGPAIVYAAYLLSMVVGVTMIAGVIYAYIKRDTASAWVRSHFDYQINVFWKALIGSVIGLCTIMIFVGIVIMVVVYVWLIYKIIKGWLALNRGEAI